MKSIFKKVAGLALTAGLALGMASCSLESENNHTFASEWTSDATHHWHAATCGHTDQVKDKNEHIFGEWVTILEPTGEAEGTKEKECSVCDYKATEVIEKLKYIRLDENYVKVAGVTITGSETWIPKSYIFVSGKQLTIPTLIVCNHEVTRGEFKEIMQKDLSTAKAYDKNGKELTGDEVLNNPVNRVNWYIAITYCNKKSIAENLTPCYSVDGVTDWAELAFESIPTRKNTAWNEATCNFEADGYRLPTAAEWEWLARGGEHCTYAGSDILDEVAWYNAEGTIEVKTKKANGYGLYDMSGNVSEWCWDWAKSISSEYQDGTRVQRGDDWSSWGGKCEVYNCSEYPPYNYDNRRGFRVVRTAKNN